MILTLLTQLESVHISQIMILVSPLTLFQKTLGYAHRHLSFCGCMNIGMHQTIRFNFNLRFTYLNKCQGYLAPDDLGLASYLKY